MTSESTTSSTDDAARSSTKQRAVSASLWVVLARPFGMGMQLLRSLVLTRLLFPEAFGLMALVAVVMQGLQMCSDVGVVANVVRHPRGKEERFLQTVWTLQVIRGAILWLACAAIAWPLAKIYDQPLLAQMLPVAGLSALIAGFGTTAWATHDRDLKQKRLAFLVLVVDLASLLVVIGLALWLRSVWALVLGAVLTSLIRVLVSFKVLPGVKHRFLLDRSALHDSVHFGKWVFLSSILTFLAMQGDRIMLGKLISTELLGIYAIALVLTAAPRDLIFSLSSTVMFPTIAERYRDRPSEAARDILRVRGILLRAGLLFSLGVAFVAPAFFNFLYDPRYWSAGWMAQYLTLAVWAGILSVTTGYCLLSLGNSRALAISNLFNLVVTVVAGLTGHMLAGLPGFIVGYSLGTAAGEAFQVRALSVAGVNVAGQDLRFTLIGGLAFAVYWLVSAAILHWSRLDSELVGLGVGAATWIALFSLFWPTLRDEVAPRIRPLRWLRGRLART